MEQEWCLRAMEGGGGLTAGILIPDPVAFPWCLASVAWDAGGACPCGAATRFPSRCPRGVADSDSKSVAEAFEVWGDRLKTMLRDHHHRKTKHAGDVGDR
jgi:hypothetical protein